MKTKSKVMTYFWFTGSYYSWPNQILHSTCTCTRSCCIVWFSCLNILAHLSVHITKQSAIFICLICLFDLCNNSFMYTIIKKKNTFMYSHLLKYSLYGMDVRLYLSCSLISLIIWHCANKCLTDSEFRLHI